MREIGRSDPTHTERAEVCSLDRLEPGRCGTVLEVRAGGIETDRLKAMGVCEGRRIMLVRNGDPLILRVLGSRVGVSARLAGGVRVEACAVTPCPREKP